MHPKVGALFDWLVDGAPGAPTPMAVILRVGPDLVEAGVPVERLGAFVRTLHPHVAGRRFFWAPGLKEVAVSEQGWASLDGAEVQASPIMHVFRTSKELRVKLEGRPTGFADLDEIQASGLTDWVCLPFKFMGGSTHAISFATRASGGFTDEHLATLRHVVRPLTRVAETLALMRTAANLLNAYVGRDAGDRILQGHVQRGDTEDIRAVIWFSDLRGFTSLSGDRSPAQIIAVLNEFFDCQVPAIERHGGEVLKFIGDGLLAIFALGDQDPADAAARALAASKEAFGALEKLNALRTSRGEDPLRFGLALHVGQVAYGNIGGAGRLDFTAIGAAVNLASRIEGLTGKLGKVLLLSADLAGRLKQPTRAVGTFELKGVKAPQQVFELA